MKKSFSSIDYTPFFSKDLKKLKRRFPTLEEDIQVFIKTPLILYHKHGIDNHGIFRIQGFPFEKPLIYKAKKFACRSLKGKGVRSGIRVIYAHFEKEDRIELIEIYYKDSDQKCEDKKRILAAICVPRERSAGDRCRQPLHGARRSRTTKADRKSPHVI